MSLRVRRTSQKGVVLFLLSAAAVLGLIPEPAIYAQTTLSTSDVSFGAVVINQPSIAKKITLANNQAIPLAISSLVVSGDAEFALSTSNTSCGNPGTVNAGSSCSIGLIFTPTGTGAQPSGTLTITTNASNSPQTVTLTGSGVQPMTLSSSSINFGGVVVNTSSTIRTAILQNHQSTPLSISSLAVSPSGEYALDPSTTCANPGSLAANSSCVVGLTFIPSSAGPQPAGTLTVTASAANSPLTVALTGSGIAPVTLGPASVYFGNGILNTVSAAKTVTLKNNQTSPVSISNVLFGGPFALDTSATSATTCPISGGTLATNQTCVIGLTFNPTSLGYTTGQITVVDSAGNSPQLAALYGTGVQATTLSSTVVNFGSVVENTISTSKSITLTNQQSVALNLSSITVPAPYALAPATTTCVAGTPVAPSSSCTISVTLTPTTAGAQPASNLTITDDASNSPQAVKLEGSGVPAVSLSPSTLAFTGAVVSAPTVKTLTLTNNQTAPLTITSITGFTSGYTLGSGTTCPLTPLTIPAGASCTIAVSLTATATGSLPGTLTIADNAPGSPQTVTLSANPVQPVSLSSSSLFFPAQFEGTTSAAKTVTLTNQQSVPLNISSVLIAGANSGDFAVTSTCPPAPSSLPPTSNCTLSITFTPTGTGTRTATLSVVDNALGSPQTISLSGSGNAPLTFSPTSITNFSAPVGTTSTYRTITITNNQTSTPVHFTNFQVTGDFLQTTTTCPIGGTGLAGGATCNITVAFNPTIGGVRDGQLVVLYDNTAASPQAINLSGNGYAPLTISNSALIFSAQKIGTSSAPKSITLTNHESKSETFTLTPSANFTATTNCSSGVIASNSNCILSVAFAPAATATPGPISGALTIADSAAVGSPLTASLTGSATTTPPPAAIDIVSPGAGTPGTVVTVTITGNGSTHFNASSVISFSDTDSGTIGSGITPTVPTPSATMPNLITAQLTIAASAVTGARNIKVTTPLTGGGTEVAQLNSAFIIADASDSHPITNVNPAFGTQGQMLNVDLTGSGTHFVQGTTYANFGDGVTVNYLQVNSATDAVASITISNTTYVGYRNITLVTGGEFASTGPQGFQIGPNNAALLSVSPNTAAQGASLPVTLTASGTHFLQDATQVSIGGGVIVGNVQVTSTTTAVAQLAVPQNATVGLQNVTVSTGGEIATLPNAFTVTGATPALVSVTPSSAAQGQQNVNVTITGNSYTNFDPNHLLADFTGEITVNSTTWNSPTSVTVNISVSQNANVGGITARLTSGPAGNAIIFPFGFTITPSAAQIVSVTPNSVAQGAQVTLNVVGLNTNWVQGTTQAAFYPTPYENIQVNEVTIVDATHAMLNVSVSTNTAVGTYGFYMATGGQVVSASISVYAQTPTLTMNPANGMPGTNFSVSFTGQFTHFGPTTLPVVSGQGVTLSNFNVTSLAGATATITISPTAATGVRTITFTTGGEIVTTYFNVTTNPASLLYVSPYQGPQNTTMNVEIAGANTHFSSATQVLFGPFITVNSITANSPTDLTVNITTSYLNNGVATISPTGWQSVFVNTGAEQVIGGFYVQPPASPMLVSAVPSSAQQGSSEQVVITGSNTNWVAGETELILGAGVTVAYPLISVTPTSITANISVSPTAPAGGNSVVVITGSEIESGTGFSVTAGASEVVSVQPAIQSCTGNFVTYCGGSPGSPVWVVSQLQTATLNIVGVGTHWLQGETTMSFGPGVVVDQLMVTSPTTATVQITVLSSAPVGYASLTAFTDGEVVTLNQAIDIEQGFATLLATTPNGAEQGATLNLQVLGRFTNWQQGVTTAAFNQDITVNSVTVIDSDNLIANITVSPLAYVDYGSPCGHVITVTTGTEQVTGLPGVFCVAQGAAQITNVQPNAGVQGSTEVVTVTGSATHFTPGVTTANFGPGINVGNVTVNSPTSATVALAITTAAPTGFQTATLTTLGEVATQQYAFTVSPGVATLNEADPNQAEQGVQNLNVHLIGQYSHFSASSTATFGPGITVNSVTFTDATDLEVNISIDPLSYTGGRTVTVTTPGVPCQYLAATANACAPNAPPGSTGSEIVSANVFSIIPGPAIISQVAPATGNEGQEIIFNITGANTHWAQNFTQFWIQGAGSDLTINSVVINSATSATVDLSISPTANPGTRSIYMVTAGEVLTDSGAFVVTGGIPSITYLSPNNAPPGTNQLEVTIHGIYTAWTQANTTVNFGPGITVASYQVDDNFTIEAVINIDPAGQNGYRTVIVQTGTQGLTSNFNVYTPPPPVPYISYYWPSSGLTGQTFTVSFTGSNTNWNPGPFSTPTQATFGDGISVNTFQVTGPTSALANITIDPSTYSGQRLIVFTTGSETESVTFNVVSSTPGGPDSVTPTLSIVDPGSGMQGAQNLTVNIIGQYTTFDATTTFSFGSGITVNGPPTILGPTIATQSISVGQEAPLGASAVIATTEGTQASGAYFTVTPSLALISAITPNTALQGNTITVDVAGQNTHWDSSTVFSFGAGIVVTSTTVNSDTDATLTIVLPPLAPVGPTNASAQTEGEIANITNGFVVQAGTPLLLSSGPGSVPQQGRAVFTILSQATQWTTNPPTVDFGAGIVLTNTIVTSDTSLTVDGFVQATTPVGYRNLTVTTGSQVLSLGNAVYVSPGPAVINDIVPATAGQGATLNVTINGINTNWVQGTTQLTFPGVLINSFTVNSPTSITANITVSDYQPAGQVSVTATTLGEVATEANAFTVTQTQPELLAVVSGSGTQGQTETVTITGQFTHFVTGTTTANFGAGVTVNSVTATSSTSLQISITVQPTATVGYRNVSITTGTEVISGTNDFQVTQGPAAILSLNPASGAQGTSLTVVVTGGQTNFANGVTTASFGGGISVTQISVTDALHANVTISIPSGTALGQYNATLTTGGEVATILGGFTVSSGGAVLSAVNPPTGNQGANHLDVTLTGQFTHFVNGTSTANFGAGITVNSLTVSSATSAVADVTISSTATLGSRNVTITTGAEVATITGGFSVLAGVPALSSVAPTSAQAGATENVVITGAFTSFQQGVSTVSFGSGITVNSVTVSSGTQLTANISVDPNATVGSRDVTVTTNSQNVTLSSGFAVTPGTPVITQINPNIGNPGQAVAVTIYGQYTSWGAITTATFGPQISVGGAAAGASGPVTVSSATTLTANITIPAGATVGPQDVTVTTGAEVETVPGGFTIQAATIPPPTIISLSPGPNSSGMPINSNIIAIFSQPMNRTTINTTNVLLYLDSNPGGQVQVAGSVSLDASGRVMTFTPSSLLAVDSTYTFYATSAVQDATGNALSYYGATLYTAFGAATTAPTVIATNPPANTTVAGTNVGIQLEFSADMDQSTQAGLTVSAGSVSVPGSYTWNTGYTYPCSCYAGGTTVTFTPTAPLQPNTKYTVTYGAPLADTAGNALMPGSFTFTTGSGADTNNNSTGLDFADGQTNVGTNFVPRVTFAKPIDPIDVNGSTLYLYNADSGKYIHGTVSVAADGMSATFAPTAPLLADTYYDVYMGSGYFDMDGNYLDGVNGYFTTGTGEATVPPQVSSIFPANGTNAVPLNAQVVVHFNEPLDPSTYNAIQVTPSAGGAAISGTNTLSSDQVTLTFVPTSPLLAGTQYNIQVSGYKDLTGNSGTTFTSNFTTGSSATTGLSLVSSTPANGASNVATNSAITLTFNYPLDPATVSDTTLPVTISGSLTQSIAGIYQVNGTQVIFTPDSPFPVNTTIYLGTCNGPTDVAGDTYSGCINSWLTTFTTGSTATAAPAPFQVIAFSPAAGATNVGLRAPVVATFNRSFNPYTVNSNGSTDFALFNGDSQSPWCTNYSRSQDNTTLQFNCYPLPGSSNLAAYINSGIQDWVGDSLSNFTSQFTTSQYDSTDNGSIVSARPGSGSNGISINAPLVLFTSLPVNSSTANAGLQVAENNAAISGTVQVLDGGYTIQFTPSSPFTPGALIQWWTTNGLADATYGNSFPTTSGYFYVAADTSTLTPTVQVTSPPTYSSSVPINTWFDIQFNTPLNPATVNSSNIYLYDNNTGLNIAGTYTMPQPNEVRIVPSSSLSTNDYVYVYVTTGLQSSTSVPASSTSWYEYTGTAADNSLPTIVSAVPYNGAQNVGVNVAPGVVFSKTINPVSVNSSTFQVTNGGTPLAGSYWFSSNDTRVEFVPNAPLPASTNLVMKLNGVLDWEGHPITFTSNFKTGPGPDTQQPTVVTSSVSSNGSIPANSSITVQFSESMDVTTFSSNNFYIYDTVLGAVVPASLTWSADQSMAYLVPSAPLAAGRQYYLYVNSGTDLAGNQVQSFFLYFYAELASAASAPTVVYFNPISGDTVGTNAIVEAEFTAPVDPNTLSSVTLSAGSKNVAGTVSLSAGNAVLQFLPNAPLAPNTTYQLTISGVKDPAGNPVTTVSNSFTTGSTFDLTSPSTATYDPAYNSTVGINVTPKIVFNKPINPLTVGTNTFRMYLSDTGQPIPLTVTPSADGLTVTLQPQIALLPGTRYYFEACCGYQDQDGNNGNGLTVYFYTGNGTDTTAPTVTVSPASGATGIPLNAQVIVSSSAQIDPTSWTQNAVQLLAGSTPVAGAVTLSDPQTLVFTPSGSLSAGTTYTVRVSGFKDVNGNTVIASNTTFTTGTAASTGGLTLTGSNPLYGASGVSATQAITLVFSQILDPTTVSSSTLPVFVNGNSNEGLVGTYAVSGNTVTFTPSSPYPAGANLYVYSCNGPTDVLGDVLNSGSCYSFLTYFTVISGSSDTTPLQVLSVYPSSGATNVGLDQQVSVTFNKSINAYTVYQNGYNALLYAGQSLQDAGSITMSSDGRTMTFNTGSLYGGTAYTVDLPAGGVADQYGNTLAATFTSTFNTSTDPPTSNSVIGPNPGNNQTVPTDTLLTLYLNSPVATSALTGNFTVTVNGQVYAGNVQAAASGYEAQFTPTVSFPAGALVQWFFSNVLDVNGNTFPATSGYFYTQAAINPATATPQVIAVSPTYGSSNVPINVQIDIEYNLPINGSTLSGNVSLSGGSSPSFTITQPLPNVVRLTPTAKLTASTSYYVCTNNSILGTNGVASQGGCYATYFTTTTASDTTSGTITVGPPNESVNVGTNAYIRLGFSEPVDETTVNSTNIQITSGGNPIPGAWSYINSGNDVIGAHFSPVNPLPASSNIQISTNGVLDYAGNEFTDVATQFTTAALPDYTTASAYLDFAYNTSGVPTNSPFTCRYSEPMDPSSITPANTYLYSYGTSANVPVNYAFAPDMLSVTMTPKSPLTANTQYIYYCTGATDLTGNGQSYNYAYFTTGSSTLTSAPKLLEANPPKGFTNAPLNTNNGPWSSTSLGLLFSQPLDENSLNAITLTPSGGSAIPIAVSSNIGDTEVTVQLPYALQPNTTYTYSISGVTDYAGNAITPVTSTFTTGAAVDYSNPTVTAATPANGATGVNDATPSLSVTFSEAMNPVLIDGGHIYLQVHNTQTLVPTTFTISGDHRTVYLTPVSPLSSGTIYDLVTANPNWYLTDVAGNPFYSTGVVSTFTSQ